MQLNVTIPCGKKCVFFFRQTPDVADTQANNEDETEQSPTQPPSGEDKGEDKGEDTGEDKAENNGEDNANEVLWAGFSQKRMSPSLDMCLAFSQIRTFSAFGLSMYLIRGAKGVVFLLCDDLKGYSL